MRKVALALLMMSALIFSSTPISQAGLNAPVNLDNPRAVPIAAAVLLILDEVVFPRADQA